MVSLMDNLIRVLMFCSLRVLKRRCAIPEFPGSHFDISSYEEDNSGSRSENMLCRV